VQLALEHVWDCHSQRLSTSSFMDYATPRAGHLLLFYTGFIETPAPTNALLVEGGSKRGMIGAAAAIANAEHADRL
jgi:aerobic carbon-monoxide dehydrogenase large subunit